MVLGFQPLSAIGGVRFCFCPLVLALFLCSISASVCFSSDDADRFLKLASAVVAWLATMDLSEARGLVLFRVIREGIGINTEAQCHRHCVAYRR